MSSPSSARPPSLLYFFSIFDPMEAGRCFLWPMRQLSVPFSELNFYRFSKRRDPFQLSFGGNKGGGCGQGISRRLAGIQHLPASFFPIFRNLQLNMQSEGGQEARLYLTNGFLYCRNRERLCRTVFHLFHRVHGIIEIN